MSYSALKDVATFTDVLDATCFQPIRKQILQTLLDQEHITADGVERIELFESKKLFSLHRELKTLLYLGVLLLNVGLGFLIYEQIDTIGHAVLIVLIGAISAAIVQTGVSLGVFLTLIPFLSERQDFKKHFSLTYLNFGIHILMISTLAGMMTLGQTLLYFLGLGLAVGDYMWYAQTRNALYFLTMAVLHGYIGLTYLRIIHTESLNLDFRFYLLYFITSYIVVLERRVIQHGRHLKSGIDDMFLYVALQVLALLSLGTFYASGNFWVVQEAAIEIFQMESVPMPCFFWAFTFLVPLVPRPAIKV